MKIINSTSRITNLYIIFLFFLQIIATTGFTQSFKVDTTFGNNGEIFISETINSRRFIGGIIIQEDDKIILRGNEKAKIIRIDKNGLLDNTFSEDGKVLEDIGTDIIFTEVALQPDGNIVILGYRRFEDIQESILVRISKNGLLDEHFGEEGILSIKNISEFEFVGQNLMVQSDDKIVILAQRSIFESNLPSPETDFMLIRFDSDGSLDKTFGEGGISVTDFGNRSEIPRFLKQLSDGKILAAGHTNRVEDFLIIRYDETGRVDSTFGYDGKVIIDFSQRSDALRSLEIMQDGKIVLGGVAENTIKDDIALVRLEKSGLIDTTFGKGGFVLTDLSGSDNVVFQSNDVVYDILHKLDGRILVTGYTYVANRNNSETFFVQYLENGTLDTDFGRDGVLVAGSWDSLRIHKLAKQSDGKIIAEGWKLQDGELTEFITRYLSDFNVGSIDFALNTNETLIYPNPIKNTATLEYTLEKTETLTVQLTDLQGRILKTYLQNYPQNAGAHQLDINLPAHLSKGMYFLRLSSSNGQLMVKVMK